MTNSDAQQSPDHVFDGGSMDCGSGLILLIRQNMMNVPVGGLLEIRSLEPTVESELPPWCRMVGHTHVGSEELAPGQWRHFVKRGSDPVSEETELTADKQKAQAFKWSLRARRTASNETTVYSRNFSWKSGASIDFDKSGSVPGSLEQFLGSLLADAMTGVATRFSRMALVIDELEGTINATLNNTLAAVGLEAGDSSIEKITLVLYVTSPAPEDALRDAWNAGLQDSPVYQTLLKACEIESRIVFL
jgi:TusA-related sulfurtransferase